MRAPWGLIGPHNCVNLRTDLLQERFEIANYIGKTLLSGLDVSSDFLSNRSAPTLKALVGGDQLMAEIKGCAEPQIVQGTFNVLITANSRLRLRIQDDVEAWRRRLVVLTSAASPAERPIPDFGARLLVDEGPGILNWAVDGLRRASQCARIEFGTTSPHRRAVWSHQPRYRRKRQFARVSSGTRSDIRHERSRHRRTPDCLRRLVRRPGPASDSGKRGSEATSHPDAGPVPGRSVQVGGSERPRTKRVQSS